MTTEPPDPDRRTPRTTLVWEPSTRSWRPVGIEPDAPAVLAPASAARPRRAWLPALAGGVIGAVLASAITGLVVASTVRSRSNGIAVERVLSPAQAAAGAAGTIVQIAERARPSVVNVDVSGQRRGLFGGRFTGSGSGVILRSDGFVITNAHVVEDASEVMLTLSTGDRVPARVVGVDADTDVAVLKADRDDLTPATVASARDLRVGELAVAIGSPLGLEQSVTAGIVSALGRTVDREGQPPLVDMIQTDAAVTQGNSGGALFNGRGALVGITTAIAASPQVGAEGIAFAIPIDIAKAVFDELAAGGRATHPWIGIVGTNVDTASAAELGVDSGALIVEVVDGAPAAQAGLRPRDVVASFGGTEIADMDDLVIAIRQRKVGATVDVEFVRDGKRERAQLTVGDRPASP